MTTTVFRRAWRSWDRFWFAPAPALNLAAARIVFAAHALWVLGSRDLAAISGVPDVFWSGVTAGTQWRYLLFPGHPALEEGLQTATLVTLAAAVAGVWPRIACFASGLLLYHLAPLETIYWYPNPFERGFTISVLALLVLSFSRCDDALTILPRRSRPMVPSGDYRWPVCLMQIFLCQVYFISGYAKLARAGLDWVSAENMRRWLLVFAQQDQISSHRELGVWLASQSFACWVIAIGAMAIDLGLIVIVFLPDLRRWLIPLTMAFHAGILLTMGIFFLNIPQFLVFVDWQGWRDRRRGALERLAGRAERAASVRAEPPGVSRTALAGVAGMAGRFEAIIATVSTATLGDLPVERNLRHHGAPCARCGAANVLPRATRSQTGC